MVIGIGGGGGVEGCVCVPVHASANGVPLRGALTVHCATPPATACTGMVTSCAARLLINGGAEGNQGFEHSACSALPDAIHVMGIRTEQRWGCMISAACSQWGWVDWEWHAEH